MQTTFTAFMKCLNEHACIHADMRTMSFIIRDTFMLKNYVKKMDLYLIKLYMKLNNLGLTTFMFI